MRDEERTKEQLISELTQLRQKFARLDEAIKAAKEREDCLESKLKALLSTDREVGQEEVGEFVDFRAIQELMDCFYKVTNIGVAILDLKGNILVATGWQDICTRFHRAHPEAVRNCVESDLFLSRNVEQGKYILYKCKNNMWDMATPIIAGNKHIANLFLGQFFFEDEAPEYEIFLNQAKIYGFDEKEYLAALDRVPKWSRETVQNVMEFYTRFADMVSKLSYGNIKLARLLSEQKRLDGVLRESEERYRLTLEAINDGLWDWDINTGNAILSSRWYTMLGYEPYELPQNYDSWRSLLHPEDFDRAEREISEHIASGEGYAIEIRMRTKSGGWRWILTRGKVVERDADGDPTRMVGTHSDITERKRAEAALLESEQRVRQLNEHILNMVMVLSHDIRGPLVAIASILKLMLRGAYGKLDESPANTVKDLLSRCASLLGTAEDYLGKASIVMGSIELEREVLDLRQDIIDAVLEELADDITRHEIVIDNRLGAIPAGSIAISANKTWLKAVYRNLFTNAVKYGGKGCTISFGFEQRESHYRLNVYNSGRPIAEEDREKLFTRFGRIVAVEGPTPDGVGLGLCLSREIILEHGGEIWYEALPDGSNFVFTISREDERET